MQFKSIIAVLALAVAVAATPVEPVAVKLVARTTPTPIPAPPPSNVIKCKADQVSLSNCVGKKLLGGATSSVPATSLVSLVQVPVGLLLQLGVSCVVNGVNVLSNQQVCCDLKQGAANTNTQTGLVNVNALQSVNLQSCKLL